MPVDTLPKVTEVGREYPRWALRASHSGWFLRPQRGPSREARGKRLNNPEKWGVSKGLRPRRIARGGPMGYLLRADNSQVFCARDAAVGTLIFAGPFRPTIGNHISGGRRQIRARRRG